jgi:hypothetical protein
MTIPPTGPGDRIKVSEDPIILEALRALEVFKALISTDEGRERFRAADDKRAEFNRERDRSPHKTLRRVEYDDIPDASRSALEALSTEQLQALAEVDAAFVADGLWVHVPSPGFLMIH